VKETKIIKSETQIVPTKSGLPVISDDTSLERYIQSTLQFPILSKDQEYEYAVRFRENHDKFAAEQLISSHLRLVVSVAYNFKNYGLPVSELIASGNVGLMQALQKFEPEKGFRFSTYAMFWIKAEIYDYILNNWSMVKIGTGAVQKKIFFGLSRAKRTLGIIDNNLSDTDIKQLAHHLDVSESDIENMSVRIGARDLSLNRPARDDSDATDMLSNLSDNTDGIEYIIEEQEMRKIGRALLSKHLSELPERDREILVARRLSDPVLTLEQLSERYKISRERVRQIEERAYAKLRDAILQETNE